MLSKLVTALLSFLFSFFSAPSLLLSRGALLSASSFTSFLQAAFSRRIKNMFAINMQNSQCAANRKF
uniref:Uncharacterized protein n=1 Tax=Anopheles braziliensis TaxID=58242 RepID=A0A2M3ZM39_9DIPT